MESWSFPADRRKSTGLPSPSTMAWIFVFIPPLVRPAALSAIFPRHWHFRVLSRKWNPGLHFPGLHPQKEHETPFPMYRHLSIWQIEHRTTATNHEFGATPPTEHHCGRSKAFHWASSGYLSGDGLVFPVSSGGRSSLIRFHCSFVNSYLFMFMILHKFSLLCNFYFSNKA